MLRILKIIISNQGLPNNKEPEEVFIKRNDTLRRTMTHVENLDEKSIRERMDKIDRKLKMANLEKEKSRETRLGQRLFEVTTKRVLVIIFLMLVVGQVLSQSYYLPRQKSSYISLKLIAELSRNSGKDVIQKTVDDYIQFEKNKPYPILYLSIPSLDNKVNLKLHLIKKSITFLKNEMTFSLRYFC